jgi:hypothetical protein
LTELTELTELIELIESMGLIDCIDGIDGICRPPTTRAITSKRRQHTCFKNGFFGGEKQQTTDVAHGTTNGRAT